MTISQASSDNAATEFSGVDFSYSFATPHRLTVGLPDSCDRTLLDCQPGYLRLAWSYDDLRTYPLAAFKTPPVNWEVHLKPQVDGAECEDSHWTRLGGWLPALLNTYHSGDVTATLEAVGGESGLAIRVRATNSGTEAHQFILHCQVLTWGESPAWISPDVEPADNMVAAWNERADRVLFFGVGAELWTLREDKKSFGPKVIQLIWNLQPGESREGWIIRPYRAYSADLPKLRQDDWSQEFEAGIEIWNALLSEVMEYKIPDPGVMNAWRACFADLFIMREPVAGGYIAAVPGTECYRAPNTGEAAIVAIALDQAGLHREAVNGYRMPWELQEPDGNWNDHKGWAHLMWASAGFKAWAAIEHYRLTHDHRFLERIYPRLLASSRWQELQRQRTRLTDDDGTRPLTYGLMPRGMGDCGLLDDGDLYGVFIPHNIWAVYADKVALEIARILDRVDEIEELRGIFETALADLLSTMDRGAITEDGYRWIPGVPGKTSGSRWGALNALVPTGILPPDHELITGTLQKIESNMSPGGMPVNTGWMPEGMWVAITLDNIAEAHLARGNGDAAAGYLYGTLNHGTPLYTWCEERGQEAGSPDCAGDRQHLWTPVAVVRCLRDCMVLEQGDCLQLALGVPRQWMTGGGLVGVSDAPTYFGVMSYQMQYDAAAGVATGQVTFPRRTIPASIILHLRLPEGVKAVDVNASSQATIINDGTALCWIAPRNPGDTVCFEVQVI